MALKSVKESLQTQMSGQDQFLRENMTKLIDHIDKQENMIKEEFSEMQSMLDSQFKYLEANIFASQQHNIKGQ